LPLCLLLSACATPEPPQPTLSLGERDRPKLCQLVPCLLPGRPAPSLNEDMTAALDDTEAALEACAVQTLDWINKQAAAASVTRNEVIK
ncbi:hypothetical protein, partial [Pseudomonas viridiflava]|uniref:hypothetical protein n=1 Tax=Pseudomonas viridiflava TaxID=33069 RepID=UPI001981F797